MKKRKTGADKLSLQNNHMAGVDERPDGELLFSHHGFELDAKSKSVLAVVETCDGQRRTISSTDIMRIRMDYSISQASRTPSTVREERLLHEDTLLDIVGLKLDENIRQRVAHQKNATLAVAMGQLAKGAGTAEVQMGREMFKRIGVKLA